MGGKVYVGGTAYDITGGKTLIGGTAYDITAGKTLVGGTAYDINFKPAIVRLFEDMTIVNIAGRNAASTARVSLTGVLPIDGTYKYFLLIYNQRLTIYRKAIAADGSTSYSSTYLSTATACGSYTNRSAGNLFISTNTTSTQGTSNSPSNSTMYGGTIAEIAFPSFAVAEVNSILSNATVTALAGQSSNSATTIRTTDKTHTLILATISSFLDIWNGTDWVRLGGTSSAAASISGSYLSLGSAYAANIFGID